MIGPQRQRQLHQEKREQHPQSQPHPRPILQWRRMLIRERQQRIRRTLRPTQEHVTARRAPTPEFKLIFGLLRVGTFARLVLLALLAFLASHSQSSALETTQRYQKHRQLQQRQQLQLQEENNAIGRGNGSAFDRHSAVGMKPHHDEASGGSSDTKRKTTDHSDTDIGASNAASSRTSLVNSAEEIGDIFGLSEHDTLCVTATESMVQHQTDFLSASVAYTNAMEIIDNKSNDTGGSGGGSGSGSMGQTNVHEMLTGFTLKYPSDQIFDTYEEECLNLGGNFLLLEEDYFSCQASSEDGNAATYFGLTNDNDGTSIELFVTVQSFASCISTATECQNFNLGHLMVEVWNTFGLICIQSSTSANANIKEASGTSSIDDDCDSEDSDGHEGDQDDGTSGEEEQDAIENGSGNGTTVTPETEQAVEQKEEQQEQSSGPSWYDGQKQPPESTSQAARKTKRSVVRLLIFISLLGFMVIIVVVQRRRQRKYERKVTQRLYEMTDIHFVDQIVDFHDNDFNDDDYDDGGGGFKDNADGDEGRYEDVDIDDDRNDGDRRHSRIV